MLKQWLIQSEFLWRALTPLVQYVHMQPALSRQQLRNCFGPDLFCLMNTPSFSCLPHCCLPQAALYEPWYCRRFSSTNHVATSAECYGAWFQTSQALTTAGTSSLTSSSSAASACHFINFLLKISVVDFVLSFCILSMFWEHCSFLLTFYRGFSQCSVCPHWLSHCCPSLPGGFHVCHIHFFWRRNLVIFHLEYWGTFKPAPVFQFCHELTWRNVSLVFLKTTKTSEFKFFL